MKTYALIMCAVLVDLGISILNDYTRVKVLKIYFNNSNIFTIILESSTVKVSTNE